MGFPKEWCEVALQRCHGHLEQAVNFCFEHGGEMDAILAEEQAIAAAAAQDGASAPTDTTKAAPDQRISAIASADSGGGSGDGGGGDGGGGGGGHADPNGYYNGSSVLGQKSDRGDRGAEVVGERSDVQPGGLRQRRRMNNGSVGDVSKVTVS